MSRPFPRPHIGELMATPLDQQTRPRLLRELFAIANLDRRFQRGQTDLSSFHIMSATVEHGPTFPDAEELEYIRTGVIMSGSLPYVAEHTQTTQYQFFAHRVRPEVLKPVEQALDEVAFTGSVQQWQRPYVAFQFGMTLRDSGLPLLPETQKRFGIEDDNSIPILGLYETSSVQRGFEFKMRSNEGELEACESMTFLDSTGESIRTICTCPEPPADDAMYAEIELDPEDVEGIREGSLLLDHYDVTGNQVGALERIDVEGVPLAEADQALRFWSQTQSQTMLRLDVEVGEEIDNAFVPLAFNTLAATRRAVTNKFGLA